MSPRQMTTAALTRDLRQSLPYTVERIVGPSWHLVQVTVNQGFAAMTPEAARALAEQLDEAAVEPDTCGNCSRYAVSADGFCSRHAADEVGA